MLSSFAATPYANCSVVTFANTILVNTAVLQINTV